MGRGPSSLSEKNIKFWQSVGKKRKGLEGPKFQKRKQLQLKSQSSNSSWCIRNQRANNANDSVSPNPTKYSIKRTSKQQPQSERVGTESSSLRFSHPTGIRPSSKNGVLFVHLLSIA
jgi:hypothetical protein